MVDLLNTSATAVVKFLINNPFFIGSQKDLSSRIGLSESRVSKVLRFLAYRGLIETETKRVTSHTRELINYYSMMKTPRMFPSLNILTTYNPRQVYEFLAKKGIVIVHCLFTASNEYAYYEPIPQDYFYIEKGNLAELRKMYKSDEIVRTGEHTSTSKPGLFRSYEIFVENFDILSTENGRNGMQTNTLQTYIDLYNFPGGAAAAEHLLNVTKFLSPDYKGLSDFER